MPSFFVHEHIALLTPGLDGPHRDAALLGSYGPDTLYYQPPLSDGRVRRLGKRLHSERTADFLCALAQECTGDAAARAYALGFVTHYAADTTFHPFVYALSMTAQGYSPLRHAAVERALDTWLMQLSGVRTRRMPPAQAAMLRSISARLCAAAERWDPGAAVDPDDAARAMRSCLDVGDVLGLLGELPAPLRVRAGGADESISPDRLQAFALRGWRHPWTDAESRDGPFELLGRALDRAGLFTAAVQAHWQGKLDDDALRAVLGDLSYLSGTDWRMGGRL